MKGLSHGQAQRFIRADADGLLKMDERIMLEAHLRDCIYCTAYAAEMKDLDSRLSMEFHMHLNGRSEPSNQLASRITANAMDKRKSDRLSIGLSFIAGTIILILLAASFSFAIRRLGPRSLPGTAPTPTAPIPDSRLLVFAADSGPGQNKNLDIYTMHMDGSAVRNLTNNPANDLSPAWSPDGKKIAFISDRNGNQDIYVMNADGSGLRKLTDNKGYDGSFAWSPDGTKIVYLSSPGDPNSDGSRVTSMNSDGSNKITLTSPISFYSILGSSPDGHKVIYQENKSDLNGSSAGTSLRSVNIDGTDQSELFSGGGVSSLRWEDIGHFSGIVMTQGDNAYWYLYRFSMDGTPAVKLGSSPTPINGWLTEGERTVHIIKNGTTWYWYDTQKKPSESRKWDFASGCKGYSPKDVYQHDASFASSPDGSRLFVTVTCDEGVSRFYLINANGSGIKPLGYMTTPRSWQALEAAWSPDGKYVLLLGAVPNTSNQSAYSEFYMFDLERMQSVSSPKPVLLTTDKIWRQNPAWQPLH